MGKVKQIHIKNRTYYFYNDQINLRDLHAKTLKIDKNLSLLGTSLKYKEVWEGVKKEIETINCDKKVEYGKN